MLTVQIVRGVLTSRILKGSSQLQGSADRAHAWGQEPGHEGGAASLQCLVRPAYVRLVVCVCVCVDVCGYVRL